MIDISAERVISFAQASANLPGHPHVSTIARWDERGIRGIRLETCRIGGRKYTSLEALARFCAATTAVHSQQHRLDKPSVEVAIQLDAAGF